MIVHNTTYCGHFWNYLSELKMCKKSCVSKISLMAIMEQATKEQDDEEWYPPSPPIYDVADKLIEINRSVGLRSFKFG